MKHATLVIALALCGCSSTPLPVPDDGVFESECTLVGVRRERGDPDEVIDIFVPSAQMEIAGGRVLVGYEGCEPRLIGWDGESFDVEPTDCQVLDGTVRYTTFQVLDGHGTIVDDVLQLEIEIFWDRTVSGWTEQYTVTCEGTRR